MRLTMARRSAEFPLIAAGRTSGGTLAFAILLTASYKSLYKSRNVNNMLDLNRVHESQYQSLSGDFSRRFHRLESVFLGL